MALDNAEFISELSIVDPPGTDPLNQGDDHIRTIKKATQQSFPNVDSAVPQTGAQMAQMAIKNEVNLFTLANTFEGDLTAASSVFNAMARVGGGGQSDIRYLTQAGLQTWVMRTESDAFGNDWTLHRRDALGDPVDVPLRIAFDTGEATFVNRTIFPAGIRSGASIIIDTVDATRTYNFQEGGNNLWQIQVLNIALGRQFRLRRNDATGSQVDIPLFVDFATGDVTFANTVLANSRIQTNNVNFVVSHSSDRGYAFENSANGQTEWIMQGRGTAKDWRLQRHVGGVSTDTPISVRFSDGGVFLNTLPTVNPGGTNQLWKSSGFVAIT